MLKLKPVMLICGRPMSWLMPLFDPEVSRVQLQVRRKRDVDAIESESRFIGQVWTKDVRFVERKDLPRDWRVSPKPGSVLP